MDLDKAKGIKFGLAIGDALGYPTKLMSLSQIKQRYGAVGRLHTRYNHSNILYSHTNKKSVEFY